MAPLRTGTDVAVVGAGIVGLAVAWEVLRRDPDLRVVVLEKEAEPAAHQTGHNSGVIHSGIYYTPGSLKARTCRAGRAALEIFCEREGIPWRRSGKVIVAVDASEVARLGDLLERGRANGVRCEQIGPERLRELEPHAAGLAAIHVHDTGVVDFRRVCGRLADRIRQSGGELRLSTEVTGLDTGPEGIRIETNQGQLKARRLVNCAGLQSDRVARLTGTGPDVHIVPFRGEYHLLSERARHLCRTLIYPVPDPRFPFLGVHLTRTIHDVVKAGPNAVPAFAREGYRRRDLVWGDLTETLGWKGTRRVMRRNWRMGAGEMWRSVNRRAFARAVQRLVPEVRAADLEPGPTGVRAQAVSADGRLVDDFVLHEAGPVLHVINAPSPAATASLAIAAQVVDRLGIESRLE